MDISGLLLTLPFSLFTLVLELEVLLNSTSYLALLPWIIVCFEIFNVVDQSSQLKEMLDNIRQSQDMLTESQQRIKESQDILYQDHENTKQTIIHGNSAK
jgi:hypothetical protein